MLDSIQGRILKKTLKMVATGVLDTASMVLDKCAEYADEAKEYVVSLDVKDTTAREARKEKRKTDES